MTVELVDVDCVTDLSPQMGTVTGSVALAQALARRLTTQRGQAQWWPAYGLDMRAYLLGKTPRQAIQAAAALELRKDERIVSAEVEVKELTPTTCVLSVAAVTTDADLVRYTLRITDVDLSVEGVA